MYCGAYKRHLDGKCKNYPGPRLLNFFMPISVEHELYYAHKCYLPTVVGILTFIGMIIQDMRA